MKRTARRSLILCFMLLAVKLYSQTPDTVLISEALALGIPRGYPDIVISPNPIEAALAKGTWKAPEGGASVVFPRGEIRQWQTVRVDDHGWFTDSVMSGAYVFVGLDRKERSVMLLEGMGDEYVYVNGAQRSGNPYGLADVQQSWEPGFNYSRLPVVMEKGRNQLLFRCSRGRLKVKLCPPRLPVMFNGRDITIPDLIAGVPADAWGSIVVINATEKILRDLSIRSAVSGEEGPAEKVPAIQPMSVRKVAFRVVSSPLAEKGTRSVLVSLLAKEGGRKELLDSLTIPFRVTGAAENHKETFFSGIDGSVQYYGILPASLDDGTPKALFLTLHGASVEAVNQSGSYYPKTWGHIVAPTNRRPYGFNWEEWGRLDAMEALSVVKRRYRIDEDRVYLTGHSMGGHGVWHIGAMFPDQFAAIGPSAGWISFWTYRFRGQNFVDTSAVREMIRRPTTPSETFRHLGNYRQYGVYILQGSEDDNVPPEEARSMAEKLTGFHHDFIYHEQKGVGHWWDLSDEPGADCVDWAPMFDFFARHARPGKERIREVDFLTSNPGVSARNNWVVIGAQLHQLKMSSVKVEFDPGVRRFRGTTGNVARIAFDLDIVPGAGALTVELDSQKIAAVKPDGAGKQLYLELKEGRWVLGSEPGPGMKNPSRYGTLKDAFRNNMVFVYGTSGSRGSSEWAFNKARYDAEKFWYQGNGSVEVVADRDFDPSRDPDCNVVLYGNRNTNAAWKVLLEESPVEVTDSYVKIGGRRISGDDLACLFIRPRSGSPTASVAAISGTGAVGMRLNNRIPYMSPGIGLPDCTVMRSDVLTSGEKGVVATGFFGLDWSVENGEFVWQTTKK